MARHVLIAGNSTQPNVIRALLEQLPAPAIVYTDPPWGQSPLTNFSRQAHTARQTWPDFIRDLAHALKLAPIAWIEMGATAYPDSDQAFTEAGWINTLTIEHANQGPSRLTRYTRPDVASNPALPAARTGCDWLTQHIDSAIDLDTHPEDVIFDPCLGYGATLKACIRTGRRCAGIELNPARLARAQEYLNTHG
jgi:hypothetical protein